MTRPGLFAVVLAAGVALTGACNGTSKELLVRPYDAGEGAASDALADAEGDATAADGAFLGGPCVDDAQCDDGVACTFDGCDATAHRCRNVPDDTRCDDGVYCDGREACKPAHGCVPGPVVTCEDGDACTVDRCVEASKACDHAPRDLDADGDPDDHCQAKHDCDDLDPTVASTHAEVCANGKDDNCDGRVDEAGCVTAAGDLCATAITVAPGTTATLSSAGANHDYAASCTVATAGVRDVVLAVTVPSGPVRDLDVWVTTPGTAASVAIQATCGDATSELACGSGGASGARSVRARARDVGPGTYFVVVTTVGETSFEVQAALLDPTPKPANESCADPLAVATETLFTVSLIDPAKDLVSACPAGTGELTYSFTLAAPADVDVYASTLLGSGSPVVGLRDAHCTDAADELRCNASASLPLFARALPAGTYVLTVAATSPIDASVVVRTSAPTTAPPDQTCGAPPAVPFNVTVPVDLSAHESAIVDGCDPGGPTAALDVALAKPSDVLLVGRFPQTETGGVSFDAPACTSATRLACAAGGTPVRVGKRDVAAGDYRVVVTDQVGATATLTALVRDAVPPTLVSGADTCASALAIPDGGGFFTGDTTSAGADYENGCDAPGQATGGAPDQVLSLSLAQQARVVFDMEGSSYTTLLEIRRGSSCPGDPVTGACYVGFGAARSFLDLDLAAGDYWVIVDGYAGAKGPWDLDVRVIAP